MAREQPLEPSLRRAAVVPLVVLEMGALGRGALAMRLHPAATARAPHLGATRLAEGFRDANAAPAGAVADLGFINGRRRPHVIVRQRSAAGRVVQPALRLPRSDALSIAPERLGIGLR